MKENGNFVFSDRELPDGVSADPRLRTATVVRRSNGYCCERRIEEDQNLGTNHWQNFMRSHLKIKLMPYVFVFNTLYSILITFLIFLRYFINLISFFLNHDTVGIATKSNMNSRVFILHC